MTQTVWVRGAVACAALFLSGCISPRSYVDSGLAQGTYESVVRWREPLQLRQTVEFQRNGTPFPKAQPILNAAVERTLRGSGVIIPDKEGKNGQITVVVNNVADTGAAAAQGFGTGLTLGLVGSTVTDGYEMSLDITANGRTEKVTGVKQAIHTAIGNTGTPPGVQLTTPDLAFQSAVESMLLSTVRDLQKPGGILIEGVPMASR